MTFKKCLDLYQQAIETPGVPVPIGDIVVCDMCSADFTSSGLCGGIIYQSKACCPECAPRVLESATAHGEMQFLRATCPDDQTFADFVREYRGPKATIIVGPLL